MLAAIVISTLLTAAEPADEAPRVTWRLSVGSFLGSVWAAPSFRRNVELFKAEQLGSMENMRGVWDSQYLVYATPVVGPWLTLIRGGQQAREDMWMLITSGVLQGVGLTTMAYRLFGGGGGGAIADAKRSEGLVLDISPYVAGRLGISVTLTGW